MLYAEEFYPFLMFLGFAIIVIALAFYAMANPARAAKAFVAVLFVFMLLMGMAGAETFDYFFVEEIVKIEPTILDEKLVWEVSFDYHGEILSWYENKPVDDELQYIVKIDEEGRVVNSASL